MLTAGAGLSWGQLAPGGNFGTPSVIPPPLPPGPGNAYPGEPPAYPPPGNWDAANLNGPATTEQGPPVPRFWVRTEYLYWSQRSTAYNSPLVTTGSAAGGGVVGAPGTTILDGANGVDYDYSSGYRINGGLWLDNNSRLGFQLGGFYVEPFHNDFNLVGDTNGTPFAARPYTDPTTGFNSSTVISQPNAFSTIAFNRAKSTIWAANPNLVFSLFRSEPDTGYSLCFLAGFTVAQFKDKVELGSTTLALPGATLFANGQAFVGGTTTTRSVEQVNGGAGPGGGTTIITDTITTNTATQQILDRFQVSNTFFGGNIGLTNDFHIGRLYFGLSGKVGIGAMRQIVEINGGSNVSVTANSTTNTTVIQPGANSLTTTTNQGTLNNIGLGGIYAQADQVGRFSRDTFAVIPELNASVGYQFSPVITGFFGYNIMYISNVVRATSFVNGQSIPALQPTNPLFGTVPVSRTTNNFPTSSYVLQGFSVGLNLRY